MTTTTFGVHVGLQQTTPDELLPLYGHIEALGFGWISVWDHFYGATGQPDDADCLEAVAMHAALALRDVAGALRLARVLDRLPPSRRAGQGDHDHRPALGRPRRHGDRRRLGAGRVRRVRHPVPDRRSSARPDRGGRAGPARPAPRRGHDVRGHVLPGHRGPQRAAPGAAQAADLDRRSGREAHAADRGAVRRRLERAVRGPRAVRRTSAPCCTATAPTSGAIRATSAARSTSDWRGPRSRCGASSAGWPTSSVRGCCRDRSTRSSTASAQYVEAGVDQVNLALRAPFDVDALEQFAAAFELA